MALRMLADFLDDLDNVALAFLLYIAWSVAGLLLLGEGLQHLFSPLSATATDWFASYLGLQVTQIGLSVGGLLNLAVRGVGVIVTANGAGYLVLVAHRLLTLVQQLMD